MRLKTDSKRQAILQAAAEVFREQGYDRATMSAVSQRIGGSKATLYRYFASKDELFLTALMESAVEKGNVFDAVARAGDLRRSLEQFGADYLALALSPDSLATRRILIAEGARAAIGQQLFDIGARAAWSRVADRLAGAIRTQQLRAEDPWLAAMHLRGLIEADLLNRALIGAKVDRQPAVLRRHAVKATEVFLRAYAGD